MERAAVSLTDGPVWKRAARGRVGWPSLEPSQYPCPGCRTSFSVLWTLLTHLLQVQSPRAAWTNASPSFPSLVTSVGALRKPPSRGGFSCWESGLRTDLLLTKHRTRQANVTPFPPFL